MKKKISAFLGPTNTGKTHNAIQKLYNYRSGVIGFPLRLLARENYELAKKHLSPEKVALITGEEKIIPANAQFFFCTVESIPENINFEFVAIDEVQMASDYDRGYIFTEKILNKKGTKETLFLGSRSIENILKSIYPEIVIYNKPRLSKLSYIGYKNLTRLPKRSAIIAFSQVDLYEIANKIKQTHGGVSVVQGALSPDVRNAQVKLFEDGKVDFIVATDAIGMGLNLNIKNIFFSSIKKFDGFDERFLSLDEISQIAGRAGRFSNDGFFGTTCDLKKLSNETISFVENYEFTEIQKIYWRNKNLTFSSTKELLTSLSKRPKKFYFNLKKDGNDHRYLKIFLDDNDISSKVLKTLNLKKLWEVCSIPDYSKNLDEYHTRFLKKIFKYLISENQKIPNNWVIKNLKAIKKDTKKIPELNYKISQVRTWSFISFKSNWIESTNKFKNEVKKIESRLSVKLHRELISEFIGEFNSFYYSSSNGLVQQNRIVRLEDKKIFFGKEKIGDSNGFKFYIDHTFKKSKNKFNNKILETGLIKISQSIVDEFLVSTLNHFHFTIDGFILWDNDKIGKLEKNKDILNPKINIFLDKFFIIYQDKIKNKIKSLFLSLVNKEMPFVKKLMQWETFSNASRAINFLIIENLGHCKKSTISSFFSKLTSDEMKKYKHIGFKNGSDFFYYKCKKNCLINQMLINIFYQNGLESFISDNIFEINLNQNLRKKLTFYEKLGFYLLKINKKNFLIHYSYYENLISKTYFFKKKQKPFFIYLNQFEKFFLNNPGKIAY